MANAIEQTLYEDPQGAIPAGYCPVCGGALYGPESPCLRCQESKP